MDNRNPIEEKMNNINLVNAYGNIELLSKTDEPVLRVTESDCHHKEQVAGYYW